MCAVGVKTYTPAVVQQPANQLLLCRLLKGPSLFGGINNVFTQAGIEDALFEQGGYGLSGESKWFVHSPAAGLLFQVVPTL